MALTDSNPLVSIVIPVFNGSEYVQEAIESAMFQSYRNIEIIVINDGSNDHGLTEIAIAPYEEFVRIKRKDNGGCASALNAGIEIMRGEFFSWLSHDDLYERDKIANQLEVALTAKKCAIVYSNYKVIDANGTIKYQHAFENSYKRTALNDTYIPLSLSLINGCTMLIPKILIESGFNTKYETTQDYEKWRQIIPNSGIIFSDYSSVYSRVHPQQDSLTKPNHSTEADDYWLRLIEDIESKSMYSTILNSLEMLVLANEHLQNSNYTRSRAVLNSMLRSIYTKESTKIRDYKKWVAELTENVLLKIGS